MSISETDKHIKSLVRNLTKYKLNKININISIKVEKFFFFMLTYTYSL